MITKKLTIPLISISMLSLLVAQNVVQKNNSADEIIPKFNELLNNIDSPTKEQTEHILTVFVHGTVLPIPSFSALNYSFKKTTTTSGSSYQKYLDHLRDKVYSICQPSQGCGLKKLDIQNSKNTTTDVNHLFTNSYKILNDQLNNNQNKTQAFYTFGWNGRLDQRKRLRASKELYQALIKEQEKVKKQYPNKKITLEIIAHSHGGNVALNLALSEVKFKKNLCVNKLILLGTPIQSETHSLINSKVFEKIYNFYSHGDMIQVIDILSTQDSISKRRFNDQDSPYKVIQVEVQANKLQPRHTEFWLWGEKSPFIFRKHAPYYPFPIATLIPVITNHIETYLKTSNHINLNIEKENGNLKFSFTSKNYINKTDQEIFSQQKTTSCALIDIEKLKNQIKQKIL